MKRTFTPRRLIGAVIGVVVVSGLAACGGGESEAAAVRP